MSSKALKMLRLELVGIILLSCTQIYTENRNYRGSYNHNGNQRYHQSNWEDDQMLKEVRVKQGRLRGFITQPKSNSQLQLVDVFLGIPYAEPPMGPFRFSPPRSPQPWRDVRSAKEFAPVCPQVLPNLRLEVKPGRHEYVEWLLPYLKNQSEDCLYLNIYAPHQSDGQNNSPRYPVMVFIHGESFEWNSGNPYDGTILAAYGSIVFVTINFRLGILGFLRPGTSDDAASNFGLLDQTAALLWLKENIAKFGGDPDSITLIGHGTGAILANLLLISPVANNKGLFKRAILMSGSALSADAIGKAPLQITKQVAYALNCPTTSDSELAQCLRNRDIESLLNVRIDKPRYVPAYAPLIDRAVIPKKPLKLMENAQLLGSFDLMYGITESEKFHILPPVAVLHGMSDDQRDEVLRDHAKATHELEPELVLSKILEHYARDFSDGFSDEYPTKNRDIVLDVLSDSGTLSPLLVAARLHAHANPKSYMYVFSHPRAMNDYSGQQRQHTVHGEELPYILGVPLNGARYHLRGRYNIGETLFSEAMMTWWCSFAYTGNPNAPRRMNYITDGPKEWRQYQLDWPEYDIANESYMNLTIPPSVGRKYRSPEVQFWNEKIPNLIRHKPRGPRPHILDEADGIGKYRNSSSFKTPDGVGMKYTTGVPDNLNSGGGSDGYGTTNEQDRPFDRFPHSRPDVNSKQDQNQSATDESMLKGSSAITMVIGFGVVFLLINLTAFFWLYHRRQGLKNKHKTSSKRSNRRKSNQKEEGSSLRKIEKVAENSVELNRKCDSKPDINEVVKSDKAYDNNSNFGRQSKLSRQNSNSTIDTHIKVKEWIQQEIVHRCSPRFLRKTRETLQREHQEKLTKQQQFEATQRKKSEDKRLKSTNPEPIYEHNSALIVRPGGKQSKIPKVSVAIDATPATRTESILNQIPIELVKELDTADGRDSCDQEFFENRMKPQVVIIEHHHSRSDPLSMEKAIKNIRSNFPTTRASESDSESASSLYAKINPKFKTKLSSNQPQTGISRDDITGDTCDSVGISLISDENIYGRTPKMTTFGMGQKDDINVTCREPTIERVNISPEEALKTIKRRNYPKVLPDIEKRLSLPAPSSLLTSKQFAHSVMDHKKGPHSSCSAGCPPQPPPRIFGTSKSLDLSEEDEKEPITTNLHVGPLLKRQDSIGNHRSDSSIMDSIEKVASDAQELLSVHRNEFIAESMLPNPRCPVHGSHYLYNDETRNGACTSRSADGLDRNIDDDKWRKGLIPTNSNTSGGVPNISLPNVSIGNPNWYKTMRRQRNDENINGEIGYCNKISSDDVRTEEVDANVGTGLKIVITPKVNDTILNMTAVRTPKIENLEQKIVITPKVSHATQFPLISDQVMRSDEDSMFSQSGSYGFSGNVHVSDETESVAVIAPTSTLKLPKIIIKPNTNLQRNRERNIPKVSAIPSPGMQVSQVIDKGEFTTAENRFDKPPIKEKPKVTRIPSFSRRKDERLMASDKTLNPIYTDKVDVMPRMNVPSNSAVTVIGLRPDNEPTTSTLKNDFSITETVLCVTNSNPNTSTIKRKPSDKK